MFKQAAIMKKVYKRHRRTLRLNIEREPLNAAILTALVVKIEVKVELVINELIQLQS